jgi:hypothetical protein
MVLNRLPKSSASFAHNRSAHVALCLLVLSCVRPDIECQASGTRQDMQSKESMTNCVLSLLRVTIANMHLAIAQTTSIRLALKFPIKSVCTRDFPKFMLLETETTCPSYVASLTLINLILVNVTRLYTEINCCIHLLLCQLLHTERASRHIKC